MMRVMKCRGPRNYDVDLVSAECRLSCAGDTVLTQQQFKEECDINTIVRRFGLTGKMPEGLQMPVVGDFTDAVDFFESMRVVRAAQEEFMRVPAELRKRFNNDPGELIAFLNDGKNRDEAIKLGLVNPPAEKTRDVVQAVDELAAAIKPQAPAKP